MPLLLCDRDGVINKDSAQYVRSAEQFVPIPGSIDALIRLHQAGWRIAVVTNQSGLARGLFSLQDLHAMHAKLHALVHAGGGRINAIFFCPHEPQAHCACRKPGSAMFATALERFNTQAADAFAVGDSLRDLQGAAAVGVRTALVRTGNGLETETAARLVVENHVGPRDDCADLIGDASLPSDCKVFDDLAAVAQMLLSVSSPSCNQSARG